ncbi:hypothetical protein CHARACLAT_030909 [Characodon lateralis]|uniref:Secreted protein n=1 Tax=Characodon lateralis TaxID=208331 RepID=A0ABU7EIA6_9TELE|nr:hypothetical protein [Characodon lateralis]
MRWIIKTSPVESYILLMSACPLCVCMNQYECDCTPFRFSNLQLCFFSDGRPSQHRMSMLSVHVWDLCLERISLHSVNSFKSGCNLEPENPSESCSPRCLKETNKNQMSA